MELDSIRPDGGNEELRLKVSALPLRLRIDQDILAFLQSFFSSKGNSDSLFDSFEKIEADWEEEEPPAINGKQITDSEFFLQYPLFKFITNNKIIGDTASCTCQIKGVEARSLQIRD